MTPAELAARCADMRAWWTRWAEANPRASRGMDAYTDAIGSPPRHVDPPITVRTSDLEQILADARTLAAALAQSVDDLTDDERAVIARHLEGQ